MPDGATLQALLEARGLSEASASLDSLTLHDCFRLLATEGRLAFLARLKDLGVTNLTLRQKVTNALSRAAREGSDEPADELSSSDGVAFSDFDPFEYNQVLVPVARALKGRARAKAGPPPAAHYILRTPTTPPWPDAFETAIFANGCFWGSEKGFWRLPGVHSTAVGYAG
eukprot:2660682-Prymnesium_polylepis.1